MKRHLEIDVSHPWDGKNPIRRPEPNSDTIPKTDEVAEIFEYLLEHEPYILYSMFDEIDVKTFLVNGKNHNANI